MKLIIWTLEKLRRCLEMQGIDEQECGFAETENGIESYIGGEKSH
ncbi:hypothetical protein OK016_08170 [Vibrio chagasii]|nr:hypothetical protein [Vibrio chagasii]